MNFKQHWFSSRVRACIMKFARLDSVRIVFLTSEHCSGTEDNLFNCYFAFCHRHDAIIILLLLQENNVINHLFRRDVFIYLISVKKNNCFNFPIFENFRNIRFNLQKKKKKRNNSKGKRNRISNS